MSVKPPGHGRVPLQSPSATSTLQGGCQYAASHRRKKARGFFFDSFLCLSATASVTFLVRPDCDLSTQHIVLFLVSRFVVYHLSVLALAPASPGVCA